MTECYRRDKFTAHQLLVRKVKFYNNITLFSLAFQYKMMEFVEHSCCQTKLNMIWKGKMAVNTSAFKVILEYMLHDGLVMLLH